MTKDEFLGLVNEIDEKYIDELADAEMRLEPDIITMLESEGTTMRGQRVRAEPLPISRSPIWKALFSAAAVVCVVAVGASALTRSKPQTSGGALSDNTEQSEPSPEQYHTFFNEQIIYAKGAVDMRTATENYRADFEKCKAGNYPNLNWDKAYASPVAVNDKCAVIEKVYYQSDDRVDGMTTEIEKVEKLKEYCNFFLGEYDDEWAGFETLDDVPGVDNFMHEIEVDGITYTTLEKISDHIDQMENEEFKSDFFVYNDPYRKKYLCWPCGYSKYPFWFNKGEGADILKKSQNKSIRVSSSLPEKWCEPIARYVNDGAHNDVTYKLADGECSIGEAIKFFTGEYWESLPIDAEDKQPFLVRYIDVYKMTEDTYAYFIRFSPTVNDVPFEIAAEESGVDLPNYFNLFSQALMVRKNDIDMAHSFDPVPGIQETGTEITKILPFKNALDIVSKGLSQDVEYELLSTDLIYHGETEMYMEYNASVTVLKPTWAFVLYNGNDKQYYNAYVDAASGKFDYYKYTA